MNPMMHYSFVCMVGVASLTFACTATENGGDSGNNGAVGGAASAQSNSNGGASRIDIGIQGGITSFGSTTLDAEGTPVGLLSISADQAKALLNDPDSACAGWAAEAEPNSVLEFIVDVSGSMLKTSSGTNGASKWAVTQGALHDAMTHLPPRQPVGISFFPNQALVVSNTPRPVDACVDTSANIAIEPLAVDGVQRTKILSAVDSLQPNRDAATPTHDAFNIASAELLATTEVGEKYVVLITDGQPTQSLGCIGNGITCEPEPTSPIVAAIADARQKDAVRTFVVGSPGSEKNDCTNADVRDWLSAAATAGDTAKSGCSDQGPNFCHFDLSQASDFGKAMSEALASIVGSVSCDWTVSPPPAGQTIDPNRANMVYFDGADEYSLVLRNESGSCRKGWAFTDNSRSKIRICEDTCALLRSNPKAQVSLIFGCTQDQITTLL